MVHVMKFLCYLILPIIQNTKQQTFNMEFIKAPKPSIAGLYAYGILQDPNVTMNMKILYLTLIDYNGIKVFNVMKTAHSFSLDSL